ncbi:hypothetical protein D7V94_11855 [Parablautia intestinalis]|uniref:Uncharacterized protein n=1 Tax=Parablautia intestinalis TaxID=2320100 RepID=A0A3A9AHR1_9FIRM|nr:hypothetical protein D7V94_11855 [Parablautia intestinalis]
MEGKLKDLVKRHSGRAMPFYAQARAEEICHQSGERAAQRVGKIFQKYYGASPLKYRKVQT